MQPLVLLDEVEIEIGNHFDGSTSQTQGLVLVDQDLLLSQTNPAFTSITKPQD